MPTRPSTDSEALRQTATSAERRDRAALTWFAVKVLAACADTTTGVTLMGVAAAVAGTMTAVAARCCVAPWGVVP